LPQNQSLHISLSMRPRHTHTFDDLAHNCSSFRHDRAPIIQRMSPSFLTHTPSVPTFRASGQSPSVAAPCTEQVTSLSHGNTVKCRGAGRRSLLDRSKIIFLVFFMVASIAPASSQDEKCEDMVLALMSWPVRQLDGFDVYGY